MKSAVQLLNFNLYNLTLIWKQASHNFELAVRNVVAAVPGAAVYDW